MDGGSPIPNARTQRRGRRASLVAKEFRDVFSAIESDDGKVPPGQVERGGRLEKRLRFGLCSRGVTFCNMLT